MLCHMQATRPGPLANLLQLSGGSRVEAVPRHCKQGKKPAGVCSRVGLRPLRGYPPGDKAVTSRPAPELYCGFSEVSVSALAASWWAEAASRCVTSGQGARALESCFTGLWVLGCGMGEPGSLLPLDQTLGASRCHSSHFTLGCRFPRSGFGQVPVQAAQREMQISCLYILSSTHSCTPPARSQLPTCRDRERSLYPPHKL